MSRFCSFYYEAKANRSLDKTSAGIGEVWVNCMVALTLNCNVWCSKACHANYPTYAPCPRWSLSAICHQIYPCETLPSPLHFATCPLISWIISLHAKKAASSPQKGEDNKNSKPNSRNVEVFKNRTWKQARKAQISQLCFESNGRQWIPRSASFWTTRATSDKCLTNLSWWQWRSTEEAARVTPK